MIAIVRFPQLRSVERYRAGRNNCPRAEMPGMRREQPGWEEAVGRFALTKDQLAGAKARAYCRFDDRFERLSRKTIEQRHRGERPCNRHLRLIFGLYR